MTTLKGNTRSGPVSALDRLAWPPPKDWQAFERMCQALARCIWMTPYVTANGRPGQKQHGVDLYGTPHNATGVHGMQCKCVAELTEHELLEEVDKAKGFQPRLAEFIVATTAPKDATLLAVARRITEEHRHNGLFPVRLLAWDDLCSLMAEHRDVAALVYPEWFTESAPSTPPLEAPLAATLHTATRAEEMHADIQSDLRSLRQTLQQLAAPGEAEAHGSLNVCRRLLQDHNYSEALKYLEELRRTDWDTTTDAVRFRIATNLGAAHAGLGDYPQAGHWYLEAFRFDSTGDKSLANRALGLLLLERVPEALTAAEEGLKRHPVSPQTWKAYLNVLTRSSPEAPLPEVPPDLAADPDVLLLRADLLAQREEWRAAEALLRQAIALPSFDPIAKVRLADAILIQVTGGRIFGGVPYSVPEMERLTEALTFLDEAWRSLKPVDRRLSLQIVQNACAMRAALGQFPEAERLLDEALALVPDAPELLARKIRFATLRGDAATARRALDQLSPNTVEEYPLLTACTLRAAKDSFAAAAVLEEYLHKAPDPERYPAADREFAHEAACLFADLVVEADLPHAEHRFDALPQPDPLASARATAIFARALYEAHQPEAARRYLEKAQPHLAGSPDARDRLMLADAFAYFDQHQAAVALYEKDIAVGTDTPSLREYIRCLLELDQRRRLTDLLASLPESLLRIAHYQWVAAAIFLRVGLFPDARAALERCWTLEPTHLNARLLWAQLCLRLADPNPARAWLDTVSIREPHLALEPLQQIGRLRHALGQPDFATAAFYEALRRFPHDPQAHLGFHSCMLFTQGPTVPTTVSTVAPDTAVQLRDNSGRHFTYVLEDRPQEALTGDHEITLGSSLGQRLLGRKVGETVPGHTSPLAQHEMTLTAIQHKYVHALHESMNAFNTRFPDEQGLVGVTLPVSDNPAERLAPVLEAVKGRGEQAREVQTLYDNGNLPIAVLATLTGRSLFDTWRGLTGRPKAPIRACRGTHPELKQALQHLQQQPPRQLLLEPLALRELHLLNALTAVQACAPLYVVQSTVEELHHQIQELEQHPEGYLSMYEHAGEYFGHTVTVKDMARQRDRLQSLLEWVRTHCDIVAAVPHEDPPLEIAALASARLGAAVYDTVLAAQGGQYLLVCDDFYLRELARLQFAVDGVWIQPLLMHATERHHLPGEDYHRAVTQLALWCHDFTGVNAEQLLFVAQRAHWDVTPDFEALVATLPLSRSEFSAHIRVCFNFLQALWKTGRRKRRRGPRKAQARKLTHALLRGADPGNSPHAERFFQTLEDTVRRGGLPAAAGEALTEWYRKHKLPPVVTN